MKAKMENRVHVEGRLYSHKLEQKVTGETSKVPGTEYIRGSFDIATDEEGLNIIRCTVIYLARITSKGTENSTYTTLYNILTKGKTWSQNGKDEALKLRVDGNFGVNDFPQDDTIVNQQIVTANFVHITDTFAPEGNNATFNADVVIGRVAQIDADPEKETPARVDVSGYVFGFKNALVPITFAVEDKIGMNYFLGLNASSNNPVFTNVWGKLVSQNIVREVVKNSAFGGAQVTKSTTSKRLYLVTGAAPENESVPFGVEESITADEFKKALADREILLAGVKERQAAKQAATPQPGFGGTATAPAKLDDFKF